MKYDVELTLYGKKFRFKDVEAPCKEDAIIKATNQMKKDIAFCSIQPSPEVRDNRKPNATQIPPVSGDDIWNQFFRKN